MHIASLLKKSLYRFVGWPLWNIFFLNNKTHVRIIITLNAKFDISILNLSPNLRYNWSISAYPIGVSYIMTVFYFLWFVLLSLSISLRFVNSCFSPWYCHCVSTYEFEHPFVIFRLSSLNNSRYKRSSLQPTSGEP